MLACNDYLSACDYGDRAEGKRISRQTWAIIPKIIEVDAMVTPEQQNMIREGHPKVSFVALNDGKAVVDGKRSKAGAETRLKLLEPHFPTIRDEVERHRGIRGDVIDAFAMLWTAQRAANGTARGLPESLPVDGRGLLMQIWA